jgi:hypothetical protein
MQKNECKLSKNHIRIKNWNNFCALAVLLLTISTQVNAQKIDSVSLRLKSPLSFFSNSNHLGNGSMSPSAQKFSANPMEHWGIMCVGEYKFQQKTGIPLRVRLGSLDYVNKLEGKRH